MKLDYADLISDISKHQGMQVEIVDVPNGIANIRQLHALWKLQKRLKGFDCVYQPSGFIFLFPIMVLMCRRKKWIVPIHNVNTPKGARLYYISKLYNELAINFFNNFVTFSKSQAHLLEEKKRGRAHVLQTSFMLKDYGLSTRQRTNQLITFMNFGNIIDYKRIDVLIKAAQQAFERSGVLFRVIIAGHCRNWNEKYQPLIRFPELFDLRISRVDDREIPNLFAESDYFVAPYQDIAQSGSTIVAVNYNTPIIASKIVAFEEIIQDGVNGFFITPASVDDLCDRIVFILNNHKVIHQNLREGQQRMKEKNFMDSVIVSQYVDFINEIGE